MRQQGHQSPSKQVVHSSLSGGSLTSGVEPPAQGWFLGGEEEEEGRDDHAGDRVGDVPGDKRTAAMGTWRALEEWGGGQRLKGTPSPFLKEHGPAGEKLRISRKEEDGEEYEEEGD